MKSLKWNRWWLFAFILAGVFWAASSSFRDPSPRVTSVNLGKLRKGMPQDELRELLGPFKMFKGTPGPGWGSPVNEKGQLSTPDNRPSQSGRPDSNRRRPAWEIRMRINRKARKGFSSTILRKALAVCKHR
jgi:hypothetical protein